MPGCYWARLSGTTATADDVVASAYSSSPVVASVLPADKGFESLGCGAWTADLSAIKNGGSSFGDGVFIVGTDIQPGTYHNDGEASCFWQRLSGFAGDPKESIATGYPEGAATVTITKTDKGFKSKNCGTWSKA
jgi:hypothetical protein